MLLFIAGQLLINLKQGMVISPFYHYGMYSEVMEPQQAYPVYEIIVNEVPLRTQDFSAQQWDKIMLPLVYYSKHGQWNQEMYGHVKRITGISDSNRFVNTFPKQRFYKWYQDYLSGILQRPVQSLMVEQKTYSPGR